jgi:hypothetical protein
MNKWTNPAKWPLLLALIFVLSALTACDKDFTKTSYSSLSIMANTYEAVMTSAGDAADRGLISEETWNKIADVANVYKATFDTASLALETYVKAAQDGGADASAKEIASQAIADALSNLGELTALYTRLTSGIEGIKSWKQP